MSQEEEKILKRAIGFFDLRKIKSLKLSRNFILEFILISFILIFAIVILCIILVPKNKRLKLPIPEEFLLPSFDKTYIYINLNEMNSKGIFSLGYDHGDADEIDNKLGSKLKELSSISSAYQDESFFQQNSKNENDEYLEEYSDAYSEEDYDSDSDVSDSEPFDGSISGNYKAGVKHIEKLFHLGIRNIVIPAIPLFREEIYGLDFVHKYFYVAKIYNISIHILLEDYFGFPLRDCSFLSRNYFLLGLDRRPIMFKNRCVFNLKSSRLRKFLTIRMEKYDNKNIEGFILGNYPRKFKRYQNRYLIIDQMDTDVLISEHFRMQTIFKEAKFYYSYELNNEQDSLKPFNHTYNGETLRVKNNIFRGNEVNIFLLSIILETASKRNSVIMFDIQMIFIPFSHKILILGIYLFSPTEVILSTLDERMEPYFVNLERVKQLYIHKKQLLLREYFKKILRYKNNDIYFNNYSKLVGKCEIRDGIFISKRAKVKNNNEYHIVILIYNNSGKNTFISVLKDLKIKHYKEIIVVIDSINITSEEFKISSNSFTLFVGQTLILKVID